MDIPFDPTATEAPQASVANCPVTQGIDSACLDEEASTVDIAGGSTREYLQCRRPWDVWESSHSFQMDERSDESGESKPILKLPTVLLLVLLVICNVTPVDAQGESGNSHKPAKEGGGDVRQVKAKYQALYSSPIWSGPRGCTSSWGREDDEVEVDAPIWLLLEIEGHLSNRQNRNRIRRNLEAQINRLQRRTDLSDGRRNAEAEKLRSQLNRYQRSPRPKKEPTDQQRRKRVRNPRSSTEDRTGKRHGVPGRFINYPVERFMSRR